MNSAQNCLAVSPTALYATRLPDTAVVALATTPTAYLSQRKVPADPTLMVIEDPNRLRAFIYTFVKT